MSNDDLDEGAADDPKLRLLLSQVAAEIRRLASPPPEGLLGSEDTLASRHARIRKRVVPRLPTPEQAARHRAFASALLELSPVELSEQLRKEPELASPIAVSALLDRSRAALAASPSAGRPPVPTAHAHPGPTPHADRAALLADIATEVAYRISPVLYEVSQRLDAIAESQIVLALAHLAASRELAARHALALALALVPQGTGDPLLVAEAQVAEGLLAHARGDQRSARFALRSAAEHYESLEEADGAEITWTLFTELLPRRRWSSGPSASSRAPQAHRFAHILSVWHLLRVTDPRPAARVAEGSSTS